MRISIFSATDSDAGAYSSYNNQDQPASSLRPSSTLTGDGASTSGVKKRFRSTPNLVITYAPHSPAADLNDNIVTTQADDTASVEDDNSTSSMVNVWDIASAKAYDAQNHTDAWQQVIVKTYPCLFIFSLFFLLFYICHFLPRCSFFLSMKILA